MVTNGQTVEVVNSEDLRKEAYRHCAQAIRLAAAHPSEAVRAHVEKIAQALIAAGAVPPTMVVEAVTTQAELAPNTIGALATTKINGSH